MESRPSAARRLTHRSYSLAADPLARQRHPRRYCSTAYEEAAKQPGFLGVESAREDLGITVSYWDSLESIAAWKQDPMHLMAQQAGREKWYESYKTRICRVERDYEFSTL
ncbi:antibiotic biosynthesis monooxygenase [Paraburkholderia sp. MMS20-SJTR3]|uniref:Antibiotic biosynthesis monooxygenase n=1 Tax=Paraburkholderia sejongensis TaxID=2886946 RepID=A0ABS8K697_9BURK|nr:antibiotic biosynthesis monooxygenase [Paraburkholderia sp. MMS20-SJTR3]MCC8397697.1 antibiotic biosynthesis monooxygenase [Paraburkholderia sp. MMS20-SJTR3]